MAAQPTPYLGSKISLISKSEIRYEGILYTVDTKESTIALAKVKSFGTEDRPTPQPIAARDEVFEYIIFKATDIKDLMVCETPKPPLPSGLPYDPAIVSVSNAPAAPPAGPSGSTSRSDTPAQPPPPQKEAKAPGYGRPPGPRPNRPHQQHPPAPQGTYRNALLATNFPRPPMPPGGPRGFPVAPAPPGYAAPRSYGQGGRRGGATGQPGAPAAAANRIKFDSEYDFEAANAKFEETLEKMKEAKIAEDGAGKEEAEVVEEAEDEEAADEEVPADPHFYDSKKSFFDNISCEAKEKEAQGGGGGGRRGGRPFWKKERETNLETFGQAAVRSSYHHYNYRRGGGGGGGGRGFSGGGPRHFNRY